MRTTAHLNFSFFLTAAHDVFYGGYTLKNKILQGFSRRFEWRTQCHAFLLATGSLLMVGYVLPYCPSYSLNGCVVIEQNFQPLRIYRAMYIELPLWLISVVKKSRRASYCSFTTQALHCWSLHTYSHTHTYTYTHTHTHTHTVICVVKKLRGASDYSCYIYT